MQRDGFALAEWRHDGFEMRAVADLAPADMKSFAQAIDQAVDRDRSTDQASRSSSLTMASPISWVPTFFTPSVLPPASRSAVR